MVFEREWPLAGLPVPISQNHSDAEDFISVMEVVYFFVLHNLRMELQKGEGKFVKRRAILYGVMVGERIFLKRSTAYEGPTIQTSWPDPYQVVEKIGDHSFVIQSTQNLRRKCTPVKLKYVLPTPQQKVCIPFYSHEGIHFCLPQQEWIGISCDLLIRCVTKGTILGGYLLITCISSRFLFLSWHGDFDVMDKWYGCYRTWNKW